MKRKRRFSERLLAILLALVLAVPMLMEPAAVSMGAEMGGVDVQNLDTGDGDPAEGGDVTGTAPTPTTTVTPSTSPESTQPAGEPTEPEPVQYYSISGKVVCDNGQTVAGAEVKENSSGLSTTTDEYGAFVINNIPSTVMEYNLTAEKSGFEITGSSTGEMEGNVSNETLTMTLVSPSYTIDGKREVDSPFTLKVDNPAADIIYSWEFDNAIFQPSSGESIPVKGTSVTGTLVKSGNLNVSLTASYGTASTPGTGVTSVEISKRTPTVNLIVTPTSQEADAGIKELTVIAEVDRVGSKGSIRFSEGNEKGTFEANDISVVNGIATTTYKAPEGADGFNGELSFTAEYSGVDEKYNSSTSATVTGIYNSAKSITWLEKDIYGNTLNPAATDSNAVTIEYGSVYTAPESKEEKINYYQIPVNKDASPAGTYTYDAVDASGSPIEADKLPFELNGQTGELQITRAMTADEQIFVRVTRRSDGYADAVATLKLTISPRKITLDKENTVFVADKTYDGTTATGNTTDFAIKVSGTPSFKRDNGTAILDDEEVTIASVSGTLDTDKVNASTYESETLQNVEIVLGGRNAQNYELTVENKSVDAEYTIKPKEYHVRINQAQRVYGTTDKYTVAPTLSQDQETGFLSGVDNAASDWEAIAKNITLQDSSTEVSPMEAMRPEAQDNHYIYAVVLDENAGNYSIVNDDTNNVYRGELIINQQLIAEDEIEEYVQISGTVTGQDGNIWIKGKYDDNPGELKLASNKNIYSGISVKDGTGYVIKEGTTDTVLIPLAQGEVDFKGVEIIFTLVNKDGNDNQISETNEMKLLVKADSEYPEVRISEPEELAVTPLESLANILTFGLFENNRYAVTANVSDQGAGVKSWSYAVIDTDHSMTPDELRSKVNSGISWTAGKEEPITVYEGEIPEGEIDTVLENKIVLISAIDNVGNSVIYASNGVVIENYLPVITIDGLEAGYGMTESINFNLSVTDSVASDTENKEVSGISSITWEVMDMTGNAIAGTSKGQGSWTGELVEQPLTIQLPKGEAREDCKVLTLTVEAADRAGNTQTVERKIIVDQTAPTWQWLEAPEQGAYVHEASFQVKIQERYFVPEKALLTVSHDGTESVLPLSGNGNEQVTITKVSDSQEDVQNPVDYTDEREIVYQLTFTQDGAYDLALDVTDQYGNQTAKDAELSFVRDTLDPVLSVKYNDAETDNLVHNDRYFQNARTASVTFTERNVDMDNMLVEIVSSDVNGEARENNSWTLQEIQDGTAESKFVSFENYSDTLSSDETPEYPDNDRTIAFDIVFAGEANYSLRLVCADLAGASVEGPNAAETEEHSVLYWFTVDGTAPQGTVSVLNNVWKTFVSKITFGLFSGKSEEITMEGSDPSAGMESLEYVILDEIVTKEELIAQDEGEELSWIKDEEGRAPVETVIKTCMRDPNSRNVVYTKATDYAGNVAYYSSDGFILDNVAPVWNEIAFTVDPETGRGVHQTESGIYNGDVLLQIDVQDPDNNDRVEYSGLKDVYYIVKDLNNDKLNDQYDILKDGNPVDETQEYAEITDRVVSPETDGEFVRTERLTADITIPSTYNSNGLYVEFYAVDWAGNILSDETIADRTAEFSIDMTAPAVSIAYDRNDPENGRYFDGNREAVITFRERNFDPARVSMDLTVEGVRHTDTLDNLMKADIVDFQGSDAMDFAWETDSQSGRELRYYTDDRTDELKVTFKGNASYAIHSVTITDAADNSFTAAAGNLVYEDTAAADLAPEVFAAPTATVAAMDFVVDKVRPVMAVSYPTDIESTTHKAYYFEEMTATFTVNEHNFDQSVETPAFVITAKDLAGNTVTENTVKASSWTSRGDERTYTITFQGNANYTYEATYKDLAGNTLSAPFADAFTVDKSAPETATVQIHDHGIWHQFLADITFGLFDNQPVLVTMSGQDGNDGNAKGADEPAISPVEPLQYYKSTRMMTWAELENLPASAWITGDRLTVNPNQQFIIYEKVTNYANLTSYFSSDGMVVDNTKPVPEITITNLSQAQNGIFNEDVVLRIDVEDPTAGDTYSGLEEVWYTVTASGNVSRAQTVTLLDNTGKRIQGNKTFSQVVTIDAETFNSNDVRVQAFARDFSQNEAESEITELKIDVTEPRISVTWDLNDPLNGRYYKDTRTATVTVTDRNFDPDQVRFDITNTDGTSASIGGWSSSSNIGVSDEATTTCRVSFPADGDYTFTLGCTDLAGNSTEYGQTDEFTIDKTVPEIEVSYDNNSAANGEYYNEERTATIRIHEHNFNASDVQAAITASLEGQGISAPSVGGFSGSGDVHTATVTYDTDGDYTFDIEYTDMAGNVAEDYAQDSFTVDLTAPEVEIFDIEDKSANNDVVAPGVRYTDINYDVDGVTITLEGANNGLVNVGSITSSIDNGQSIKFNDFAREERMDDLYQLTAKITDLAGNETEETVLFSVNRYGSVYVLDEATAGWLSTDPENDYTYINQEREIGVQEYNVDDIEEYGIAVNRDGELAQLQEGTDFTVTRSGSDVQWKVYHYTMNAENFADEGNYTVTLSSRDMAANSMNNETAKKSDGQLPLQFTVDKTAPTVVVSGVEDGGQYRAAARVMTVDAKDNLALSRVTVRIGDDTQVYEAEELRETDGIIRTEIPSANSWQDIEVTAEDAAGNQLGQTEVGSEAVPVMMAVLVTPNILIQYYMNKPVFYGSIVIVLLIIAAAVILVRRRLKDR